MTVRGVLPRLVVVGATNAAVLNHGLLTSKTLPPDLRGFAIMTAVAPPSQTVLVPPLSVQLLPPDRSMLGFMSRVMPAQSPLAHANSPDTCQLSKSTRIGAALASLLSFGKS